MACFDKDCPFITYQSIYKQANLPGRLEQIQFDFDGLADAQETDKASQVLARFLPIWSEQVITEIVTNSSHKPQSLDDYHMRVSTAHCHFQAPSFLPGCSHLPLYAILAQLPGQLRWGPMRLRILLCNLLPYRVVWKLRTLRLLVMLLLDIGLTRNTTASSSSSSRRRDGGSCSETLPPTEPNTQPHRQSQQQTNSPSPDSNSNGLSGVRPRSA